MDNIKYAYQLDHDGYYIGLSVRQPSPAEPGVWLMPAHSVVVTPPQIPEGHWAKFDHATQTWSLEAIPAPPEPEPMPTTMPVQVLGEAVKPIESMPEASPAPAPIPSDK